MGKKKNIKWYLGPDELKITNLNGFSLSTFSPAMPCPEVLAVKIMIDHQSQSRRQLDEGLSQKVFP